MLLSVKNSQNPTDTLLFIIEMCFSRWFTTNNCRVIRVQATKSRVGNHNTRHRTILGRFRPHLFPYMHYLTLLYYRTGLFFFLDFTSNFVYKIVWTRVRKKWHASAFPFLRSMTIYISHFTLLSRNHTPNCLNSK